MTGQQTGLAIDSAATGLKFTYQGFKPSNVIVTYRAKCGGLISPSFDAMVGDHPCLTPKSLNGQVFKGTDNLSFDVNDFFHGVDESSEECSLTDCKVTSKTKNSIVI